MKRKTKKLLYGLASFVPGVTALRPTKTGGTDQARYCYSVWLRHLVIAQENGLCTGPPATVAELGPGDSLGIGLAALLSGAERYFGLDIVDHASSRRNISVFDELVQLFQDRAPIPGKNEFFDLNPEVESHRFPSEILTEDRLRTALDPDRVAAIRRTLTDPNAGGEFISYFAPWNNAGTIRQGSVDMILSQAVLEHVDDLPTTYRAMAAWLKPGGFVSHQIDFRSHGTADEWNGHWMYSDRFWRLMRGRRTYLINREPYSTHATLLQEAGLRLVAAKNVELPSNIPRSKLAARFRNLSDEDLTISSTCMQAVRTSS